tara:strand:- start:185 stop:706 length:522 start_codon:yes stop_codon:yes gene_type:complete
MSKNFSKTWVLLPVIASLASQCDETPRGTVPTSITTVEIALSSTLASSVGESDDINDCLMRLGTTGTHVRPSWRDNSQTSEFDPEHVSLIKMSANRFVATFNDVPVNVQTTLTVHDENECRRNPIATGVAEVMNRPADGRVVDGVTANGTPLNTVVGNNALLLTVGADGTVLQ